MSTIGIIIGSIANKRISRGNTLQVEHEKNQSEELPKIYDIIVNYENMHSDVINNAMKTIEIMRHRNVETVIKKAEKIIKAKNTSIEFNTTESQIIEMKEYDPDWYFRFFNSAGNVSDEYMQDLWAKTFAGKIKNPGKYSYKVIDILHTMTKEDAEDFVSMSSMAIYLCVDKSKTTRNFENSLVLAHMNVSALNYPKCSKLREKGILREPMHEIEIILASDSDNHTFFEFGSKKCEIIDGGGKKVLFSITQFTKAGEELYSLISSSLKLNQTLIKSQISHMQVINPHLTIKITDLKETSTI